VAPLIGLSGLEEGIADPLEIVGRDADAGIGDAKHQPRSLNAAETVTVPPRSVNLTALETS